MKTLHALKRNLEQPVLFFQGIVCQDHYHDGYADERTSTSMHGDCANRVFNQMASQPSGYAALCACQRCQPHYHWVSYHRETSRCLNCRADNHPTPAEGSPIVQPPNPMVGTREDALEPEEEPEDDGDVEHGFESYEDAPNICAICDRTLNDGVHI